MTSMNMDRTSWIKVKEGCYSDRKRRLFIKVYKKHEFNWGGYHFQSKLPIHLSDGFQIAKFSTDPIEDENEIITLAPLYDFKEFSISPEACGIVGKALSTLHVIGSDLEFARDVKRRTSLYNDMAEWDKVVLDAESEKWRNEREQVIRHLPKFTANNIKAILHRDVIKRNLPYCDDTITLIDFDFTAIDYLAIEIGNFLMELLAENKQEEARTFLDSYLTNSPQFALDAESCLKMFLRYLCANTFPWYCKGSVSSARFDEFKKVRSEGFGVLKKLFFNGSLSPGWL